MADVLVAARQRVQAALEAAGIAVTGGGVGVGALVGCAAPLLADLDIEIDGRAYHLHIVPDDD